METVQHIPVPLSRVRDSVLAVITELGLDLRFVSSEPDDSLCSDL